MTPAALLLAWLAAAPPAAAPPVDAPPVDAPTKEAAADAPTSPDDAEPDPGRWGVSVVPRFAASTDEGLGAGVRGAAFWYRFDEQPYKTAVSFQAFATTRLVQHHFLRVDALDAFGAPLRVTAEAGWFQTLTFTYCGDDPDVGCDQDAARDEAKRRGLVGDEAEAYARERTLARFMKPYGNVVLRLRLGEKPHRPEVFAGWRGELYVPGDFFERGPYEGSLYAERFPAGEPGFASVLLVGAALDGRDHEPDPSKGYLLEASLRAASPLVGSTWAYGGGNVTALVFAPLLPERRLTSASRVVLDAIAGDAPLVELAQLGGARDVPAFGGADAGRGIRQQRFPGRLKLLVQHELRTAPLSARLFDQAFRVGGAVFVDGGVVARELGAPLDARLRFGFGAGLRVVWNESFVMRVDVGVSPVEGLAPFVYTKPDHPF